ncbi:MAG TPA: 3-methyl-2-oxobutanoate hydroxymethyltransferase [Nitrospiria bacterium]|nr:3-methyl-2-oxobutanoate hydroxymethyltransferase [Nitrospiria bacterium]HUK55616.1 3-methyl-2-oxobutanoate hydroxymethyltransferase [Nitrospiria bacterium]
MSKITVLDLLKKKREGKKLTMLTAYDFPFAQIVDEAGIDMILVGDSLGVVVQGNSNTLPVTMDEMLYHTRISSRAVEHALVIGDMPFMSFQPGIEDAVRNACRFIQAGASAVKLEGGEGVVDRIRALARMDIPVMGHVGLTPQSVHRMGGYKVQGREPMVAERIMSDARAVEEAGAFGIVLEGIPLELGRKITKTLSIPTIGIGAGPHCDGQVLVLHDLLGLFERFHPTFVKTYANLKSQALEAIRRYKEEVELGKFPSEEESYK